MTQFDVYANPIVRSRTAYPYVAVLQSDLVETGSSRVVAFMAARERLAPIVWRLAPVVQVRDRDYILIVPWLTNVLAADLRAPIDNVASFRDAIVAALDRLFLGV